MSGSRDASVNVAINAVANSARSVVALLVLFLLTPFVIQTLGADQYGLWILLASVIGYLELMDCGLATATVKYVGQFEGKGSHSRRNRLISTLLLVYLCIAACVVLLAACLGLVASQWLPAMTEQRATAAIVFAIMVVKTALNLPLSLFVGVLFGRQKILLVSATRGGFHIAYGIATWLTLSNGGGLIGFAAVHAGASLLEHLLLLCSCVATTPRLRVSPRLFDWRLLREAVGFSTFALTANISSTALLRTDPIIVRLFQPLWMVAVYGVALKISEQLLAVTKHGLNAVTPFIAQLHGAEQEDGVRTVLMRSTRWSLAGMLIFAVPVGCFATETLTIWVGPQFAVGGSIVGLLAVSMIFRIVQEASSNVLAMTGLHRFVAVMAALNAVSNVALSIVFVRYWGAGGVALATLLTTSATTAALVQQACRRNHVTTTELWRRSIAPPLHAGLVQFGACLAIRHYLHPSTWATLSVAYVFSALSMIFAFWLLAVSTTERRAVFRLLGGVRSRWLPPVPQLKPTTSEGDLR